jgi:hypothetical protein
MAEKENQLQNAIQHTFVDLIQETFGSSLQSVIIYGSYLTETFTPGVSDINVLIVLEDVDPASLADFGRRAGRHMQRYRITPLVLSRQEFLSSSDVFPMEYLDIVSTHKVIHGEDATTDLAIDRAHLRHEVEHQLRGYLLSLRQLVIASRGRAMRPALLHKELQTWYGSLSAILRGVLRLHGAETIPSTDHGIVEELNRVVGLEPGPFLELLSRDSTTSDSYELISLLASRLGELVKIVDAMDGTAGER